MDLALDLNVGWGIGEATFERVAELLRHHEARTIVEFGSGVSSIRLALALPAARILSIESDPAYLERIVEMARHYGAGRNLNFELRPLQRQRHVGSTFLSYASGPLPAAVDAVIIDGPPRWTRRGREACLYQIAPNLRLGGIVFLDDFSRPGERKIVRNWMAAYPAKFRANLIETGHVVCVLEKVGPTETPRRSMRTQPDHLLQSARLLLSLSFRRH